MNTDEDIIRIFEGLVSTALEAQELIRERGVTVDVNGSLVPNPAVLIEQKCSAEIARWTTARPDLFGERKRSAASSGRGKFQSLRAVE